MKRASLTSWVAPSFFGDEINFQSDVKSSVKKTTSLSDEKLWVEEFPPIDRQELAVNKKKVAEFFDLLQQSFRNSKKKRILLLTGPPGCGKSATVASICKEIEATLRDWRNPFVHKYEAYTDRDGYVSQVDQFLEFALRSSKYNSVCETGGKYVVQIEELPNIFIHNPLEFHPVLRKISSSRGTSPIIFILSDVNGQDALQRSLFPQSIQSELSIVNIVFNPVASTLMTSALNRVASMVAKSSKQFSVPSKEVIAAIVEGCNGDIRNAINSLQFTLRNESPLSHLPKPKTTRSTQKGRTKKSSKIVLEQTMNGCKDSSLAVFRALGKILYCKRDSDQKDSLPSHLRKHERHKLIENQNGIFDKTAIDSPSTFCLFIHHNCPPFYQDVGDLAASLERIADADIVSSYWDISKSLEVYSSSLAIRGVMFHLNAPSKSSFRPLTGSRWFAHQKVLADRKHRMRHFYRKSGILKGEQVAVDIMPWVCKIDGLMLNPEESKLHREIGLFNIESRRHFDNTIDIVNAEEDIEYFPVPSEDKLSDIPKEETFDNDPEEDFFIEEYMD